MRIAIVFTLGLAGFVAAVLLCAPLRSEIKPERSFGLLTLAYKLKGIGGESYSNLNNRRGPPKLAVSNGGGDVCTGAFQYG